MKDSEEKYLQIGELAKKSKVTPRTIKHYEDKGIIQPYKKTPGGFRLYDNNKIKSLERIKNLQRAGLSLKEVKEIEEINKLVEIGSDKKIFNNITQLDEKLQYLEKQLNNIKERLAEIANIQKYLEEVKFQLQEYKHRYFSK